MEPKAVRHGNRSTVERVNARLKDGFGGRHVRVRGHAKVFAHIMFGVLALAIDRLRRHMPRPSPFDRFFGRRRRLSGIRRTGPKRACSA